MLNKIFLIIPEKFFLNSSLSVTAPGDFLQLCPVKEKLVYTKFSDKDSITSIRLSGMAFI